jgi:hypothetical protein
VTIDSGSVPAALRGTCAEIDVQGNAVQVDAGAATVAVVSLAGDRIAIELGNAGQVVIRGNDAVVTAVEADRLDIRGDRNVVTVSGTLTAVSFQGNDNVVRGTPGDVSDGGARNIVG